MVISLLDLSSLISYHKILLLLLQDLSIIMDLIKIKIMILSNIIDVEYLSILMHVDGYITITLITGQKGKRQIYNYPSNVSMNTSELNDVVQKYFMNSP